MVSFEKRLYKFTRLQANSLLVYDTKENPMYSKGQHLKLLLAASLVNGFAEGVSQTLNGVPTGETLLSYIKSQDRKEMQSAFDAITERNVRRLKKERKLCKAVPIAIDWHDVMYYGNHNTPNIIGTQPKKGSHYSYEYLTASVLVSGERLVIAVSPIFKRIDVQMLAMQMIERICMMGIKVKYVTMDGGFFGIDIIKYLEHMEINYILRMQNTSSIKGMKLRRGQRLRYTTNNHSRGVNQQASFTVVVAYDNKKKYRYLFATNMPYSDDALLELFKKRWGIETGYRMCNQFLIRTTSRDYTVRLFYYLLSCIVYNAWVMYNRTEHCIVVQMKLLVIGLIVNGKEENKGIP